VAFIGATLGLLAGALPTTDAAPLAVAGVTLTPSRPSGQPVGTTITWTATASGPPAPGGPIFRFSVGPAGGPLAILQDFSPDNTFDWTPLDEGAYTVKVSVRDGFGAFGTVEATAAFTITSRVTGGTPVVTATAHPLVALYSAPPCTTGQLRVEFRAAGGQVTQTTPGKPCQPGKSINVYVAGMRAATTYYLQQVVDSGGGVQRGPVLTFTTGTPPVVFPTFSVRDAVDAQTSTADGIVLHMLAVPRAGTTTSMYAIATDLLGRVVWYHDATPIEFPTRAVRGGTFLMLGSDQRQAGARLLEVDLAGHVVRETNLARINEQLAALGQDRVIAFHHELTRLPDGKTLVLGYVERLYDGVQGATGPVDVMGTVVLALDQNWQVVWVWNAYDHLDVNRAATLGETCTITSPICPPLYLAPVANDWLHANAISYSPSDGNIIVSLRNQDWVVKVDYQNGTGTGKVLWRLGPGGDIALLPNDPSLWFTHQHDATYVSPTQIGLFDNGTKRCQGKGPDCHSRGQVLAMDETARTATLAVNADLGNYSAAWGSVDRLSNGNHQFASGNQLPGPFGQSIEVTGNGGPGTTTYVLEIQAGVYRSYRMKSLYEP
jgi:hypothetical protein